MHIQYVQYMRGVDVTDQLQGNYSSQLKCYKWWQKLFNLVVDQSMVNNYVCWVADMEALGLRVMSHLAFKIAVGKHLIHEAMERRPKKVHVALPKPRRAPAIHVHYRSTLKRKCIICGHPQRWYCPTTSRKHGRKEPQSILAAVLFDHVFY